MQKFARDFTGANFGRINEQMRLVGFCLLVKKDVVNIIGGLDENYCSGNFEDDDLCLRSCIAGYKNIIAQDVFIHHYGSMTFKGNAIDHSATMRDNHQYFAEKWRNLIETNENGYKIHLTREQQLKKLLEWGEERFSRGNLESAINIFGRVLQLDRTNHEALNNIGVIQWQLGNTISAINTFQMALRYNPEDTDALENLFQAAAEAGRFDLLKSDLMDTLKQMRLKNPDIARLLDKHQENICSR